MSCQSMVFGAFAITLSGLTFNANATLVGFPVCGGAAGNLVDINWGANNPGDWTRMITAFSPVAIPISAAVWLFGSGLLGLIGSARRKRTA